MPNSLFRHRLHHDAPTTAQSPQALLSLVCSLQVDLRQVLPATGVLMVPVTLPAQQSRHLA